MEVKRKDTRRNLMHLVLEERKQAAAQKAKEEPAIAESVQVWWERLQAGRSREATESRGRCRRERIPRLTRSSKKSGKGTDRPTRPREKRSKRYCMRCRRRKTSFSSSPSFRS